MGLTIPDLIGDSGLSKQWRLVFAWPCERGETYDIYLDNHDNR